jgi:CDP-diacylglycerol pyrophosphatase
LTPNQAFFTLFKLANIIRIAGAGFIRASGAISFAATSSTSVRIGAKLKRRWRLATAAFVCVAAAGAAGGAADRDALWLVVHGLCVVDQIRAHTPAPCAEVDLEGGQEAGWAIVKDIFGKTQFLLVPTRRLEGIENPLVGTSALPNYWRAAWSARNLVSESARKELPRDAIGMAINAANARTQDQLHIHIDCVRADVREALLAQEKKITTQWADLKLLGHTFRARRIDGAEPEPDPFALLANDARESRQPMGDETLAVIGVEFPKGKDGFILLSDHSATPGRAHAENLLDHACALGAK